MVAPCDASLGDSWHETYIYGYFDSLCESRTNRVRASTWIERTGSIARLF
ncbi:hypothetical protein HMPREF1864_00414 [Peptoniphilus sp. DNF00840]|nr:hypothetical protein HMPREF1864_00414 [Peptoniphilus sp. DNF00840]